MTLMGPADADHYRIKVGNFGSRFYVDPLPACDIAPTTEAHWPAISTIKKANSSDWSFVALKRVAEALERRPRDLDGLTLDERYERLKAYNKTGLAAAADRGTSVHAKLERALRGEPATTFPGDPGNDYIDAINAFIADHKPELIAAEVVAVNRTLNGVGYGGTLDVIARIGGKAYIIDWKSRGADSSHGAYADEARQIGGYASAEYLIVDGPQRVRLPDLDGGLIVSIKPDGYRVYPVDLETAAAQWRDLHTWWCAKRGESASIGKPWAPREVTPAAAVSVIEPITDPPLWCSSISIGPRIINLIS